MMMMSIESPRVAPSVGDGEFRQDLACAERSDVRILITGGGGVDKRAVAKAIHRRSRRAHAPFLTINCAGRSDALLESKLFGRARGGKTRGTRGCLEQAHYGTIFIANVGSMSSRLQAMLLQFLETGEIRRVGDSRVHTKVDVRVVSSAEWDLLANRGDMNFREDLFYRLNVMHLVIPAPLQTDENLPSQW
jgi:transcriptional regulator with PAS, ATPase and Fis domain